MASGEKLWYQSASTGILKPVVSGGALVAPDSGSTQTATYSYFTSGEEVKSFYADVSFQDDNDGLALIVAAPYPSAPLAGILITAMHIVFTRNGWQIQYASGGALTTEFTGGNFTPVQSGKRVRVGWRIAGSNMYVLQPDGTEYGPVSAPGTTLRNNNGVIYEHFRSTSGAPGLKIYAVAANRFTDPSASGRTNIFAARNDLANASWGRQLSYSQGGLLDGDGGNTGEKMLETAANNYQWTYQLPSKDGTKRRYTVRFKVKLVGRDYAFICGTDGTGNIAEAWFNLTTGLAGTITESVYSDVTFDAIPLKNGFFELILSFAVPATSTANGAAIGTAPADNTAIFTGDPTKGIIIHDEWFYERPI
jgi:hypothetical protein